MFFCCVKIPPSSAHQLYCHLISSDADLWAFDRYAFTWRPAHIAFSHHYSRFKHVWAIRDGGGGDKLGEKGIWTFQEMVSRANVIIECMEYQNARSAQPWFVYASIARDRTNDLIYFFHRHNHFRWCKVKSSRLDVDLLGFARAVPMCTLWHRSIEIYHFIDGNCCCCCCKCFANAPKSRDKHKRAFVCHMSWWWCTWPTHNNLSIETSQHHSLIPCFATLFFLLLPRRLLRFGFSATIIAGLSLGSIRSLQWHART